MQLLVFRGLLIYTYYCKQLACSSRQNKMVFGESY